MIDRSTGLTKLDLVRYYDRVADHILPHLKGRPVALLRGPAGIEHGLFFQKHGADAIPGAREIEAQRGDEPLIEIATREALLGAAQMNVIEFHTWNAQAHRLSRPDRMVLDLDPGAGVRWSAVREAAQLTRALLEELGLRSWLKTSGSKGLHIVVPIAARWATDTVRSLARAVVQHLADTLPERFVARSGAANRVGRIFVDYLRNGEGATTVSAYSARARPGLGVSMPIAWDELAEVGGPAEWTIVNAPDRMARWRRDPWAEHAGSRQSLSRALDALADRMRRDD